MASSCNLFSATTNTKDADVGVVDDVGDVGNNVTPDATNPDPDATCVPESDAEFCERDDAQCGTLVRDDNCGAPRTADCGTCPSGFECGVDAPRQCGCVPETETDLCARLAKDCGELDAMDNCGAPRTVNCGTCIDGAACGESTPNVCGCPCEIDDVCYPAGSANPANPCEVCDPTADDAAWTIQAGEVCDDEDACTENDMCSTEGQCLGDAVDCSVLDAECQQGVCDSVDGCVAMPSPDSTPCAEVDSLVCTTSSCMNGACEAQLDAGSCLISSACHGSGTINPANDCEACDPGTSTTSWTNRADGMSCAGGTCMGGSCTPAPCDPPADNECFIDGQCYGPGDLNPQSTCDVCDPMQSKTAWTLAPDTCVISGECYAAGESNPNEICQECDPATDTSDWSGVPNDTVCSGTCTCFAGECKINGSCTP